MQTTPCQTRCRKNTTPSQDGVVSGVESIRRCVKRMSCQDDTVSRERHARTTPFEDGAVTRRCCVTKQSRANTVACQHGIVTTRHSAKKTWCQDNTVSTCLRVKTTPCQYESVSIRCRAKPKLAQDDVMPTRHHVNTMPSRDAVSTRRRSKHMSCQHDTMSILFGTRRNRVNTAPSQYDIAPTRRRVKTTHCQNTSSCQDGFVPRRRRAKAMLC